jgi:hypothetical protein
MSDVAKSVVRVAESRHPGQTFTCHPVDRRGYDPFPDLPSSVTVLELLRWTRIVSNAGLPAALIRFLRWPRMLKHNAEPSSGIRLMDVPADVRHHRRVGDPWYVVEAFIVVEP